MESTLRNRGFEKLLLEAIDDGLSSLGNSCQHAIYFHLEKTFKINKRDIPYKIEEFADAIEKIFGLGAKFLKIQIMKHLYEKVGHFIEYDQEDLVFTEYVAAARQSFLKEKKGKGLMQGNESQRLRVPVIDARRVVSFRL